MKVTYDIEYLTQVDGYDNTVGDYENLAVEFEGTPEWQDDSFDYAGTHCTGGVGGTHHVPKYLSMQDSVITWGEGLTEAEEDIVRRWLCVEKNREALEEYFIEQFKQLNQ